MKITQETIDQIFAIADAASEPHQADALMALYQQVFPQWEEIAKLDGWPTCGRKVWEYICRKFMEFDRKHHGPDYSKNYAGVMPGSCWMNRGFASDESLGDWEVEACPFTLKSKETANV